MLDEASSAPWKVEKKGDWDLGNLGDVQQAPENLAQQGKLQTREGGKLPLHLTEFGYRRAWGKAIPIIANRHSLTPLLSGRGDAHGRRARGAVGAPCRGASNRPLAPPQRTMTPAIASDMIEGHGNRVGFEHFN